MKRNNNENEKREISLIETPEGLTLTDGTLNLCADYNHMIPRISRARIGSETLVKAARIKDKSHTPTAIDATAGLGEDSILLAAMGYRVFLYEKDPIIYALLADGLERFKDVPELSDALSRMEAFNKDSIKAMGALDFTPDIILLDPMFPGRSKSGLIKKKFQLLQKLEAPCDNEEELLNAAIAAAPGRIIIKRPAKAPGLAGHKVSYQITGATIRYDVIIP